jgi:hypothetical protein
VEFGSSGSSGGPMPAPGTAPFGGASYGAPKKKSGPAALLVPVFLAGFVYMFICPKACLFRLGGDQRAAINALRECPRARALLGDDPGPAWVGCMTGKSKSGCDTGTSRWQLPVSGDKGRGTYSFYATMTGGEWKLSAGTLEVGDETLDIAACIANPKSNADEKSDEPEKVDKKKKKKK